MATFLINLVSFLIFLVYLPSLSIINANNIGFSVDLIHRDSFLSPYYNPSQIPSQRLQNALQRSTSRMHHFKQLELFSRKNVASTIISNTGEYFMNISIGTPRFEVLAVADTGSDLTWVQCKPCPDCYKQIAPLFDSKKSSTYRTLSCPSSPCVGLRNWGSCSNNVCQYKYYYTDNSFTMGDLATETFTLDSNSGSSRVFPFPNKIFGCGHKNKGNTFTEGGSGLIGLGGGSLSLISQLGPWINGKFSYCLAPYSAVKETSRMSFGAQAEVLGHNVVSTPLVSKHPITLYHLTLEGMSVGRTRFSYKNSLKVAVEGEKGNIVIDTGTPFTYLRSEFYHQIETAVKDIIRLTPIVIPESLNLCYQTNKDISVPITVHFTGADVKLKPENTFIRLEDDVICFIFLPFTHRSIFGSLVQANFLVGYDLKGRKVSFKPVDCTKH